MRGRALLLGGLGALAVAGSVRAAERTVVVLLFDGFAPALVDALPTPSLDRMRAEGAFTHELEPVFPTVSLINQVTLSTGCWPARHGIVSNRFLDPERGLFDHSPDGDWLLGCEHLHEAAERQGVRSAAFGWVGRDSTKNGKRASYVSEAGYDASADDGGRAREVALLLRRPPAERPRLVLAYFNGPDDAEHFTGLDSDETRAAVAAADRAIGIVLDAIDGLEDRDRVSLFVTTDHGMVPTRNLVNVTRVLLNRGVSARVIASGTSAFLYLDDPRTLDAAHRALSGYEQFEVYRKDRPPAHWHLGSGPRVGDLVISARPPYFIEDVEQWPSFTRWLSRWGPEFLYAGFKLKATHGYPPDTPGVAGILYARGSGIARGRAAGRVRVVDVHPTLAHLLGIRPGSPSDGEIARALLE